MSGFQDALFGLLYAVCWVVSVRIARRLLRGRSYAWDWVAALRDMLCRRVTLKLAMTSVVAAHTAQLARLAPQGNRGWWLCTGYSVLVVIGRAMVILGGAFGVYTTGDWLGQFGEYLHRYGYVNGRSVTGIRLDVVYVVLTYLVCMVLFVMSGFIWMLGIQAWMRRKRMGLIGSAVCSAVLVGLVQWAGSLMIVVLLYSCIPDASTLLLPNNFPELWTYEKMPLHVVAVAGAASPILFLSALITLIVARGVPRIVGEEFITQMPWPRERTSSEEIGTKD